MTRWFTNSIFTLALFLPLTGFAGEKFFEIKSFAGVPSSDDEIRSGLHLLYSHQEISSLDLEKHVEESKKFQAGVYQALDEGLKKYKGKWPVQISSKIVAVGFATETTIRFPSLIQRPGNHPTNTVVARMYTPVNHDRYCVEPLPTTIFLHHILNEVPLIEKASIALASGVVNPKIAMVVLHMPLYGDRSVSGEEFLTPDMKQFRVNIAQAILDMHLLKNLLETLPEVRAEDISLSGISLGSVMGITMGAFDQSFQSYGFLVGGGDMAKALMNRVRSSPDSEVAKALKSASPREESLRDDLAAIDGLTWLHRYRNKDMYFINANQDEVIDYEQNVLPVVNNLKLQGNNVSQKVNNDHHVPTGSIMTKLRNNFLPLVNFLAKNRSSFPKVCPDNVSN